MRIVLKPGFVKRSHRRIMGLFLGRDDDLDVLRVNLFQRIGVGITCVSASVFAFFAEVFLCVFHLVGKLFDIVALIDHVATHDQPMFLIHYDLAVVPGMGSLTSLDFNAVRIGCIKTADFSFRDLFMDGFDLGFQDFAVL